VSVTAWMEGEGQRWGWWSAGEVGEGKREKWQKSATTPSLVSMLGLWGRAELSWKSGWPGWAPSGHIEHFACVSQGGTWTHCSTSGRSLLQKSLREPATVV
jgi:hypothetical protein